MIITQFSAIPRNIVVYSVVSLFNCLWMLPKKGKRSCLSSLVLSSTSTRKMTALPPPTGYKTTKIAIRFTYSVFSFQKIRILFVYIEDITWPGGDRKFLFECWKILRTSEIFFQHEKRNFVFPSGHVMLYLLYKHQWNTKTFHFNSFLVWKARFIMKP